ncbi:hypothetical protein TruAng_010669 [Truncatella angustata]|nr:hypothetical protein TruAng_010669 [Truncatella angustata]
MVMAQRVVSGLAILASAQSVTAHTWVEMVRRISSSGSFVGDIGYVMGHMNRSDTGFSDTAVQIKIDDVTSNPKVCGTIGAAGYTNKAYPPITASPGEFLALQYAENGHVSFPDQTPRGFKGGNIMIYATSEDITNIGVNDVLYQWNTEGTGGDQKGKLIGSHFFDDGQCYENPNASPIRAERAAKYKAESLLCQSTVQLPSDLATSGSVNLLWVWDWPQNPNESGKNTTEIYTSCMTVNLQDDSDDAATSVKAFSFAKNLDITDAAIPAQVKTLIEVEQRGTGTASPAAATDVADATTTRSASATTSKATLSSSKSKHPNNGVKTVTVTEAAETVTEYQTVTVGAGAGSGSSRRTSSSAASATATSLKTSVRASRSSSSPVATGAASITGVEPFLRARITGQVRRLR